MQPLAPAWSEPFLRRRRQIEVRDRPLVEVRKVAQLPHEGTGFIPLPGQDLLEPVGVGTDRAVALLHLVGQPANLFALGIVLSEMLLARPLFSGKNEFNVIGANVGTSANSGDAVLAFSEVPPNRELGLLVSYSMTVCAAMTLLLVPLDDTVVFPTMDVTLPVDVGDEDRVLLIPRHDSEFAKVGTIAKVADTIRLPGGARGVSLAGRRRGRSVRAKRSGAEVGSEPELIWLVIGSLLLATIMILRRRRWFV